MAELKSNEIPENLDFGDDAPPEGYDPDAKGYEQAPIGEHLMVVADFAMADSQQEFKYKGQSYWLNQLRPRLEIVAGQPHAGASIRDMLPMPTRGQNWCAFLANRWAKFLTALGYDVSKAVVPKGFSIHSIIGKRCRVKVELSVDADGQPREYRGEVQHRVALFGYEPAGGTPPAGTATPTAPPKATAPAQAATADADFEL